MTRHNHVQQRWVESGNLAHPGVNQLLLLDVAANDQARLLESVLTRFAVNHCRLFLAICSVMTGSSFTCTGSFKGLNWLILFSQSELSLLADVPFSEWKRACTERPA